MEEILFYIVMCPECGTWSVVEEVKTKDEEDKEDLVAQCPQCGIWDDAIQHRHVCSSDIEAIDDTCLYNLWAQISGYIQTAARVDSLDDDERRWMTVACENTLQALSEAPSSKTTFDEAGLMTTRHANGDVSVGNLAAVRREEADDE